MAGAARATMADCIPFIVEGDHMPLIEVKADGSKALKCLAELAASAAADHGITEFTMTDHNLTQALNADAR